MELAFENLQKKVALNPPQILKIVKTILRHEGVLKASLSVVFVSYQRIRALNKKFLGRDYATDVLAFDMADPAFSPRKSVCQPQKIAGEIIISTDAALRNSGIYKTALSQEIVLYVIHGVLHLLDYDDLHPCDRQKMHQKERELLKFLGTKAIKSVC